MHVILHLSKFYDWDPVPSDVKVTPADISSGKVMPDRNGGWRMRVVKNGPTHRTCTLGEGAIIGQIIFERADTRRAGRIFSRKQAVAHLIMENLLDGHAEWAWITKIEVHDDGPDKELFEKMMAPHYVALHGRRAGSTNIDPYSSDTHTKAYNESAKAADHVAHLNQHFGVKS